MSVRKDGVLKNPSVRLGLIVALLGSALAVSSASAVRTKFFRTEGYQAFKTCRVENAALASDGRVMPGHEAKLIGDPGARTIWRLAKSGNRWYASSGDQGKVFRVGGDETEVLASLHNYELFAVATDKNGAVFAAGAPSGAIMKIEKPGEASTLFTVPEGLVFDLLPDKKDLLVATGERGRIYRVSPSGDATVLAETNDLHVRRLVWSHDGKTLWAGTDGRGLLLEIDPSSGESRVAFDAEEDEVVSIVPRADGSVLFAANRSPQAAAPNNGGNGGDQQPPTTARLYVRDSRGSVRPIWDCPERTIHDLAAGDGVVYVATGSSGALYSVTEDGSETLLWRAEEEQVLCLARDGDRLLAGTGNPGRIYALDDDRVGAATVISSVLDARDHAVWGKLSWEHDGPGSLVQCETRSGFTAVADETWSGWSASLSDADGSQIQSPPGRYIQWRGARAFQGRRVSLRSAVCGLPTSARTGRLGFLRSVSRRTTQTSGATLVRRRSRRLCRVESRSITPCPRRARIRFLPEAFPTGSRKCGRSSGKRRIRTGIRCRLPWRSVR